MLNRGSFEEPKKLGLSFTIGRPILELNFPTKLYSRSAPERKTMTVSQTWLPCSACSLHAVRWRSGCLARGHYKGRGLVL